MFDRKFGDEYFLEPIFVKKRLGISLDLNLKRQSLLTHTYNVVTL